MEKTFIMIYIITMIVITLLLIYKLFLKKNGEVGDIQDALLNPEELEQHAREIARNHTVTQNSISVTWLITRMNDNFTLITSAYKKLNDDLKDNKTVAPAAEWLLDNYYIIEQQIKEIRQNLNKKYYLQLPVLKEGALRGYPRIYAVAHEIVAHTDGRFDEKTLISFIEAYQSQNILSSAELWAVAVMVRIALVENIRRICEKLIKSQNEFIQSEELASHVLSRMQEDNDNTAEFLRGKLQGMKEMNPSFAEHLLKRLKKQGIQMVSIIKCIDEKLAENGMDAEYITHLEHQQQAMRQVSIGNSITSLRLVSTLDWSGIFEILSPVEKLLREDPAGIYSQMDFASRDYYRHNVEKLSIKSNINEIQVAKKAVECAQMAEVRDDKEIRIKHIGYYLIGKGKKTLRDKIGYKAAGLNKLLEFFQNHPAFTYLGSIFLSTLVITGVLVYYAYTASGGKAGVSILTGLIVIIPASDIAVSIINWMSTHFSNPVMLPKLELLGGIPEDAASMVVIPTLIPNKERVKELIGQLEVYYLANREKHLYFSLVGDFKDSNEKELRGEDEIIDTALLGIKKLNEKYANGHNIFYYFHRHRQYNDVQKKWMGWERKRGALMEFNALLKGAHNTTFSVISSNLSQIMPIKYVITLDADTNLPKDAARKLIGTLYHPLNRAILDKDAGVVTEGYGLLQPRINVDIVSANKTFFSRIFAGEGGVDPYTTAVSDVYQDLFGEGIFTGKGIYDLNIFEEVLKDAIPENTVLSHDLLEGSYVRTGLVTDIDFVDGYPSRYNAYTARLHRWVRGDWQLMPWLKGSIRNRNGELLKNPLSIISRWKIFDNLRRSLIAPAVICLLIFSFGVLPGSRWLWLFFGLLAVAFTLITASVDSALAKNFQFCREKRYCTIIYGFKAVFYQVVLLFIFLPYQAYLMIDAIVRTLYRVFISKKNTLEWVTAADAEKRLKNDVLSFWRRMWIGVLIAALVPVIAILQDSSAWLAAVLLFCVWGISPVVAYNISSMDKEQQIELSSADGRELRKLARKTWRYFEDFVTEEDHYLPPDNYQEDPPNGAAHRTSPTNIGFLLISILAARDLGYIGMLELGDKLDKILHSIEKLEKWKGHLYNWYDTRTLEILRPRYISTVDSGNFIGYLMVLRQGIEEYLSKPLVHFSLAVGLEDTMMLLMDEKEGLDVDTRFLHETAQEKNISLAKWNSVLHQLSKNISKLADNENQNGLEWHYKINHMIASFIKDINELVPWIGFLDAMPEAIQEEKGVYAKPARAIKDVLAALEQQATLSGLYAVYPDIEVKLKDAMSGLESTKKKTGQHEEILHWVRALKESIMKASKTIDDVYKFYCELVGRIELLISEMKFVPLFDKKRQLFSIGYNVEEEQLTKSYYDLFASEARQASYIAIARGEIDQKHWHRLGRNLTSAGGYKGLVSWTGTMFEYLMPLLIMKNYKNTLWDETYRFVIESQKKYGRQRQVPWGTSESGYYAFDIGLNYQYKAFGVPELGLKRGLSNDMVVAPYATVMALMVDPAGAIGNIRQLQKEGVDGPYGLYEAIDYTPERMMRSQISSTVKSFMVHHQGMSLIALVNYLNNNIMQQRFHADPMVKSAELLLQERVPTRVIMTKEYKEKIEPFKLVEQHHEDVVRVYEQPANPLPNAHILSNGEYSVLITDRGSGYSRHHGTAVSRWREELQRDNYGTFFYIQNINSNNVWSATYAPYYDETEKYKVVFSSDKAEFMRKDGNIDTHTEVVVSPEDSAEIRRISLTNHSEHTRVLEVTSYFEVVLAPQSSDVAHPAFSNLFVRTEFIPEYNCLLANRRPREEGKNTTWAVHAVAIDGETVGGIQYETDRAKFIGRGRDLSNPIVMDVDQPLTDTVGPVLDPIMSLRCRVRIEPGQTARIAYVTGISDKYEEIVRMAQKYQDMASVLRAFELAWTRSQVESKYLGLKAGEEELILDMLPQILYNSPLRRQSEDVIQRNVKGQTGLWAYGISGDIPIILVSIKDTDEIEIVHQLLKAHEYWRVKGFHVDIVILNEDEGSYTQPLQDMLRDIISISHARDLQDKPGGVFIRPGRTMPEKDRTLLMTVARMIFKADAGTLAEQIKLNQDEYSLPVVLQKKQESPEYGHQKLEVPELVYYNGWGGFTQDGKEYIIQLKENQMTPAPWINVISNECFGILATEAGGGYTWAENSRENKLTPWSNDPVRDPAGEAFYLRDEDSGEYWSVTPLPIREQEPYKITHGYGYTIYEHISHGIHQQLTVFVPKEESVKICIVNLKNISNNRRNISATYYIRPVLGVSDQSTAPYITTNVHRQTGALLIENKYNSDYPGRIVFMDASVAERTYTGDRSEFIGEFGDLQTPIAMKREKLSNKTGAAYDPCAAMQVHIGVEANEEKKVVFMLGQSKDLNEIMTISTKYRDAIEAEKALQSIKDFWSGILGAVKVTTPDHSMDLMLNGWLVYQTISCRIWSRSAFYQSGGAYGFRDQLQDVMATVYVLPELAHTQILRHAEHQFVEGDVQHWWHPVVSEVGGADKGIRTKFSDDLVWLPFVTADYIENTEDSSILDIEVPYIEDELLGEEVDERYNIPLISEEKSSVYEHCVRAVDRALKFGEHGIPLMGSGDWNDGMSTVGNKGRGESVWLGWFLFTTLIRFIPICEARQDFERAKRYKDISTEIMDSIEKNAWDGSWYRRAYFDDGTPMGSVRNTECKIDSLAQSWSVISGAGREKRSKEAMEALEHYLIKRDEGLIMLLTPPFDKGDLKPGYIKGYVPGVRENGGQYTHAAIWVVLAFAKMGHGDKAWELFNMINPVNHARTPIEAARYKVEPYVMAADVYAVHPHIGRGGWTWYTGAAGWMYRVGIEHILGLKKRGEGLIIDPCIPREWEQYSMEYKYKEAKYIINIKNPDRVSKGVKSVKVDGTLIGNHIIQLKSEKHEYHVEVIMGI
ncbi:glucoamylase family protein [Petroclostridium sp. X23]|uniref:GH36-type glycosyl hydrolase domain-containing protein n=1 Tax=Petroclostridium sp. X23 TaxID=3045146 RepID=UPI0024AD5DB3|nr:glucoamylase family protein [Petroclostridium sp. X23]WHH60301.1 glucoamylase family protein [Petroclostridium sp. X23]